MATGGYRLTAVVAFLLVAGTTAGPAGQVVRRITGRPAWCRLALAGQATGRAAAIEVPSPNPRATPDAAAAETPALSPGPAACRPAASDSVDLSDHLTWLQSDGLITYGPVPMEPGLPGTPRATPRGTFHVQWKADANYISTEYDEPMPYAVFFAPGGVAFHGGSLHHTLAWLRPPGYRQRPLLPRPPAGRSRGRGLLRLARQRWPVSLLSTVFPDTSLTRACRISCRRQARCWCGCWESPGGFSGSQALLRRSGWRLPGRGAVGPCPGSGGRRRLPDRLRHAQRLRDPGTRDQPSPLNTPGFAGPVLVNSGTCRARGIPAHGVLASSWCRSAAHHQKRFRSCGAGTRGALGLPEPGRVSGR